MNTQKEEEYFGEHAEYWNEERETEIDRIIDRITEAHSLAFVNGEWVILRDKKRIRGIIYNKLNNIKSSLDQSIKLLERHLCDNPKKSNEYCYCELCKDTRSFLLRQGVKKNDRR